MNNTSKRTPFNWADFFSFKSMVALNIMQALYILVAVIITVAGLIGMFIQVGPFSGFFPGILLLVLGNIGWRLWCELVIVMFRINKTLSNIDDNTKGK